MRSLHRLPQPAPHYFSVVPLLSILLPFACGIAAGEGLYSMLRGQAAVVIFAGALVAVAWYFIRRKLNPFSASRLTYAVVMTSSMLIGLALLITEREASEATWSGEERTLRVLVTDNPKSAAHSIQLTGKILSGENVGRTIRLRLAMPHSSKDESKETPTVGSVVLCHTVMEKPHNSGNYGEFDYATWLRRNGVAGTGFCRNDAWRVSGNSTVNPPFSVSVLQWRNTLVQHYADHFKGRDLGILAAITLGDKSHLDSETRSLYSEGGVSHVLALSGLHLSILFSLYQLFVLRLARKRKWRVAANLVGVASLWAFAFLAGMPLSLLRAAIMFTMMHVCGALQRSSFSLSTLTTAALLLLLVSPSSLFDIGLRLSFLSVLSIVLFASYYPRPAWMSPKTKREQEFEREMKRVVDMGKSELRMWTIKQKVKELLRRIAVSAYGIVCVSLTAQLATAPLVAYYFHTFSVYGLVANLFIVPLVYPLLAAAIAFLALPFLRTTLAIVMSFILHLMESCLTIITAWPHAVQHFYPDWLTTALLMVTFTLAAYGLCHPVNRLRRRYLFAATFVLCVATSWDAYRHRSQSITPQIVIANTFDRPVIHLVSNAHRSFLWLPASGTAADSLASSSLCRGLWASRGIAVPKTFSDTISRRELAVRYDVANFCGCRVAVIVDTCDYPIPQTPTAVDYLVLAGRLHARPATIFRRFRPHTLVVSASLSSRMQQRYVQTARSLNITTYNLQEQGALTIPLKTATP